MIPADKEQDLPPGTKIVPRPDEPMPYVEGMMVPMRLRK